MTVNVRIFRLKSLTQNFFSEFSSHFCSVRSACHPCEKEKHHHQSSWERDNRASVSCPCPAPNRKPQQDGKARKARNNQGRAR